MKKSKMLLLVQYLYDTVTNGTVSVVVNNDHWILYILFFTLYPLPVAESRIVGFFSFF